MKLLVIYTASVGGAHNATGKIMEQLKSNMALSSYQITIPEYPKLKRSRFKFELLKRYLYEFTTAQKIAKKLVSKKFDAVYTTSPVVLFAAYLTSRRWKLFFHYHGETYQNVKERINPDQKKVPFAKALYLHLIYALLKRLEYFVFYRVTTFFVPSAYSKQNLKAIFPFIPARQIKIIPYGIDHTIFFPGKKVTKKFTCCYVGRIDPNKGLTELIQAFQLLSHTANYQLLLAVVSCDLPEYEHQFLHEVSKLPREKYRIEKNKTPAELAKLYQQSDVAILPSKFEQLPLSYLESLACGTPMITTKVGELPYLQARISKELLLSNTHPKSIAAAVMRYKKKISHQKKKIRQRCISVSKRYSWEYSAWRIYEEIKKYC